MFLFIVLAKLNYQIVFLAKLHLGSTKIILLVRFFFFFFFWEHFLQEKSLREQVELQLQKKNGDINKAMGVTFALSPLNTKPNRQVGVYK
jgi:hypothetical protein